MSCFILAIITKIKLTSYWCEEFDIPLSTKRLFPSPFNETLGLGNNWGLWRPGPIAPLTPLLLTDSGLHMDDTQCGKPTGQGWQEEPARSKPGAECPLLLSSKMSRIDFVRPDMGYGKIDQRGFMTTLASLCQPHNSPWPHCNIHQKFSVVILGHDKNPFTHCQT